MGDFDPTEFDKRRPRRSRDGEYDDAWAAAEEDDLPDESVDVEDLAAGYTWDAPRYPDRHDGPGSPPGVPPPGDRGIDLGPLPPSVNRLKRRGAAPRSARLQQRYDRSQAYPDSPSFHKSEQNPLDRALSFLETDDPYLPAKPKHDGLHLPGPAHGLPWWGIVILVILGFAAVLALMVACVSVLALAG